MKKRSARWWLLLLALLCVCLAPSAARLTKETRVDYGPSTRTAAPTAAPTPTPEPTPSPEPTASPTPAVYELLQKRDQGYKPEAVTRLQTRLRMLGYFSGEPDGIFGDETFSAVVAFQRNNGLEGDGLAGADTQRILFESDTAIDATGRVYVPDPTQIPYATHTPTPTPRALPMDDFSYGALPLEDNFSQTSYMDGALTVRIFEETVNDLPVTLAQIAIEDASYLRAALAGTLEKPATSTLSRMAAYNRAVIAVSGDDFLASSGGFSVRQGHALANANTNDKDLLIIDTRGDLHIFTAAGKAGGARELDGRVYQAFTSGPALVINGILQPARAHEAAAPLTAIGQTGALAYVLVSSPGGHTANQLGAYLLEKGCAQAYALSAGNASGIYFRGALLGAARENARLISDILYFAAPGADS